MRAHAPLIAVFLSSLAGCPESGEERADVDAGAIETREPVVGADAGLQDASWGDAGADASSPGASGIDASASDARADDASAVDASGSDASTVDARTDDAGSVRDGGTCHPGNGVLAGGDRRFGFCQGDCHFELTFVFPTQPLANLCMTPQVNLTVHAQPPGESKTTIAHLTEAAWQRAADIGYALRDAALKTTYGCPDCADGGASTIVLDLPSKGLVDATYEFGNPPAVLAEADAFLQALIDQLRECSGPDIVGCTRE